MANHILKQDGKILASLYKNLERLQTLNQLVAQYLEKNLSAHCRAASIEKQSLIMIADNGNWATQLRFQVPDLLENLRKHPELCALKSIICKTRPNIHLEKPQKKSPRYMKKISPLISQQITAIAEKVPDEKLKKILKRIADRN